MDRKKELTQKQKAFLDALFEEECYGDFRKAMRKAGYTDTTDYMSVVRSLREEILERAETYLALHAPFAAMEMLGIVSEPKQIGARDKVSALKEVMDRGGLVKVDKHEVKSDGVTGAIFILPAKE